MYKRQALRCSVYITKPVKKWRFSWLKGLACVSGAECTSCAAINVTKETVSYTHLDVYKRQAVEMRQMNCTLGAPEYALISALSGQLARYYCLPYRSGGGLSDAKAVDAQAGVESALNLKQARDAGVNLMFHALGAMDSFLSISYEKWLLDEETIGRIDRLYNGAPPLQEDLLASIGPVSYTHLAPHCCHNSCAYLLLPA